VEAKTGALKGRRILLLHPHMVLPGGALNYMLKLAEQLQARGVTVGILTLQADRRKYAGIDGIELLVLDGPLTSSLVYWLLLPFWQRKINRQIQDWQPDMLVPQVFPANWWAWLYRKRNEALPIAWICQEPSAFIHSLAWINALRPRWKSLLAKTLRPLLARVDVALVRQGDRNIANSHFTAAAFARIYGFAANAVACPGIDFAAFASADEPKMEQIITVARLTKFKRVDFLLEVFSAVLQTHPGLTYHIVGTGEEEAALQEQARLLGLSGQVVFHGPATDLELKELYRRARLFLHGSVDEPFGMAPLEAIASGTPVVAHRSGGPAEFVTEACGELVDSLEVAEWARSVIACLDRFDGSTDDQRRVRECARRFDWEVSLQPAVEVIAGLCAEKRRMAPSPAEPSTGSP
jgi:glycosyltransferase involved in cell wall biosynthesis